MTDEQYQTHLWLNRNRDFQRRLDADRKMLIKLETRISGGVAQYETDGASHDSQTARARHEDALLDYSEMCKKVESEESRYLAETVKTKRAIDELSDDKYNALATKFYINGETMERIAREEHYSRAQAYRYRNKMLDEMTEILKGGKYD